MRIILAAIVVLLGVNLMVDVLDSKMKHEIIERNRNIQRLIEES
jgi:hypothetical protein|tara:strand:+ start:198 stop:329 length:132 start_codon:yes stop_codon:yes gene_type:complete